MHLLPGERGEIWGRLEAISLKHEKIEEKLLWRAYRNSPTLFRTVPLPTPGNFSATPIISGTGKATEFKFGWYIHMVYLNKSPLKAWKKGSMGKSWDGPNCLGITFIGSIRSKTH